MGLITKIFGTYSQRQIKKIIPTVDAIENLADRYRAMSDEELRSMTDVLKKRLADGETTDDILPDAFAVIREADDRVLGKRPFRVQLMGGIILHQGRIAEMKTGEGKTLVATLPAYLNALTGEGVHIVTVNEYLAGLGAEEMGRVYGFLGLTTGLIVHDQTKEEKQKAYNADITYGTNNEFGFDYLRDNMVIYKERLTQRGHAFAIVDEVDSILIDEARTPLIISGEGDKSTDLYDRADAFVRTLRQFRIKEIDSKESTDTLDADYIVDEKAKTAVLTEAGVKKAEQFFNIENLSDPENTTLSHHINQAIKAHGVMMKDVDYVNKDGQIIIVDSFTGRMMFGRRYSDGLHQAIEAKEHVKIEKENKTLATITFQNYFRMYKKLSGMTGTALTEENEFREIYNLDVVEIPTNKPMIRIDHHDVVYKNKKGKYDAIINQVIECHEKGQPVLVGTVSIEKSEELSKLLRREGIKHTVLNAKYHEKEAEIVAGAGKYGTVTISTNMAGRGTDIMLGGNPEFMAKQDMLKQGYDEDVVGLAIGSSTSVSAEVLAARKVFRELFDRYKREIEPEAEKIKAAGGLFIIGTERHESRRIDNQLRGRSGRQGDPGESRFFLSLDDDLMRLFGSERILGMVERLGLEDDQPIEARILSNSIENAQKQLEDNNFARRKNVLSYDDVMNQQRTVIYKQRREVLDGCDLHDKMTDMITTVVDDEVNLCVNPEAPNDWKFDELRNYFLGTLCSDGDFRYTDEELSNVVPDDIKEELEKRAKALYAEKEKIFGTEQMREIERVLLLRNVDEKWMDHLEAMEDLKGSVGLNAYAQRNPISEYRIAAADMFDAMIASIREDTVRMLLSVQPRRQEIKRVEVAKVTGASFEGAGPIKKKPVVLKKAQKVGRNDPCPCGSGKKYKKCCGINDSSAE
ncbi:protein translocase subunit SecA [Candidatus Colimorpha enterica]|mgnify:CR=1 FL=1|uniref:Protein translocase subunit SecA n=1 Tax=Candidatus Colimorpha enterica TaxID=3083063 RepID=R6UYI2_9BACT|nr:protein translocase subunit SecA [Candidatus Colimorpha enterica]